MQYVQVSVSIVTGDQEQLYWDNMPRFLNYYCITIIYSINVLTQNKMSKYCTEWSAQSAPVPHVSI